MSRYAALYEEKLINFTHATSLETLGAIYLRFKMREEGLRFNKEGRQSYIDGWLEHSQESDESYATERHHIVDEIAATLAWSNVHFIDRQTNTQITNAENNVVEKAILSILEDSIQ